MLHILHPKIEIVIIFSQRYGQILWRFTFVVNCIQKIEITPRYNITQFRGLIKRRVIKRTNVIFDRAIG